MKPHNYLIAIGLFSLVVVSMLMAAANLHSVYEDMGIDVQTIDETQSVAFDKISDIEEESKDVQDEIKGTDVGGEDAGTTFFGGAVKAFQIVIRGLTVPYSIIQEVGDLFHIPQIFIAFAFTATILTVVWTAVYMIFRFTGQ